MKAHIGVDADSALAHTVVTTAANVNDVTQARALLHGEETHAFGDAGYTGVTKREENQASTVTWNVAMKPGKRRVLPDTPRTGEDRTCQGKHTCQGRASVSCSEEPVQTSEDALSRSSKEHRSTVDVVRYG
jgi:IS5 family transposase